MAVWPLRRGTHRGVEIFGESAAGRLSGVDQTINDLLAWRASPPQRISGSGEKIRRAAYSVYKQRPHRAATHPGLPCQGNGSAGFHRSAHRAGGRRQGRGSGARHAALCRQSSLAALPHRERPGPRSGATGSPCVRWWFAAEGLQRSRREPAPGCLGAFRCLRDRLARSGAAPLAACVLPAKHSRRCQPVTSNASPAGAGVLTAALALCRRAFPDHCELTRRWWRAPARHLALPGRRHSRRFQG
jgi:hypothetical protein